ncbi:MAG: tetratricopeptide repeat protein [Bacteroidales bacterium]
MWRKFGILFFINLITVLGFSQSERKHIRQGNDEFTEKNFVNSEVAYRGAVEENPESLEAHFNIGDALYKQEKYQEAAKQFSELVDDDLDKDKAAKVYHNLGNSLLNAGKIKESIEAYKKALKNNPGDIETKHNLTHALKKLKQQEQEDQQDQKDKNQQQDQQDKEDDREEQEDQEDQEDQQEQQQQSPENQQQNEDDEKEQEENQQQQQSQEPEISREDAERLLQALENDEKLLQEKLKKKIEKEGKKAKSTKEW